MLPFWCDECRRVGRPFNGFHAYTTPRLNAACFGAMSVSVLGDFSLCFHPYTTPRLNAARFGAMSVSVLGDPSLCFHPCTTPRLNAACFGTMSVSDLGDASLCYPPPRLNDACLNVMAADVRLLCCTPCTAVSVRAVLFGCFYCGSCGRYPYTLRSDWALLLCCGFDGWYLLTAVLLLYG